MSLDTLLLVKRLIINADDFGLTPGVDRAILELNRAGVLPSATLMATGECFEQAAEAGCAQTTIGIGCHVTLVDGKSVLGPDRIPHLVGDAKGNFRQTLGSFAKHLLLGQIPQAEIEAEATAQIERLQAAGIRVTHVDTHKHTHMFPGVYRPLLRAAVACGVAAIRNPFEPDWSLRATRKAGLIRRFEVRALRVLRRGFLQAAHRAGVATPDGSIGILATGTLDAATLRDFLKAMPDGTWELCCHPGYQDEALLSVRTRLRQSRETERQALLEVLPAATEISLMHYGKMALAH